MVVWASAHDPSRFDSRDPLKRTNNGSICLAGPGKPVTANRLFVIAEVEHTWWTLNTDKIPTIWSSTPNQDASGAVVSVAEGGTRVQITTEPGLRMCPLVNQIVVCSGMRKHLPCVPVSSQLPRYQKFGRELPKEHMTNCQFGRYSSAAFSALAALEPDMFAPYQRPVNQS